MEKIYVCHLCGSIYFNSRPFICTGKIDGRECSSNAFIKEYEVTVEEVEQIKANIKNKEVV